MKPVFFATSAEFRAWLEEHHDTTAEQWVGFHKKSSGKPSVTWPEAVDQALCYGWIDSVRKSLNDTSYMNRFTPRKLGSTWSAKNVKRMKELIRMGVVSPAGLKAFEERPADKTGVYSYEQRHAAKLDASQERRFRSNKKAWSFFKSQPPSYRQTAIWWVVSAKKEETRLKRLARLIGDSEHGRTVPPLTRPTRPG
jgi:uncharacterized protein YdeI (YjbR/CyaY-like superfamily)